MGNVTFVGACGSVTGSSTLIEAAGRRILVDCGLFQGDEELDRRNRLPFPYAPHELDGVLLTHAHLDHCGLLPRLVAEGFRGPIWCTRPTLPLATLVLEDAAKIQEEEARFARKKGYSRHADPRPLYESKDAHQAVRQLEALRFGETHSPVAGVRFRFLRAGHLLGASSIEIEAEGTRDRPQRWLFSGDIGRYGVPLLVDPEPPTEAPHSLVLESTYGDRRHEHADVLALLGEIVEATFRRGGSVVVPAFALGRTQDLLFHLSALVDLGKLDPSAVFVDSPMAIKASEIYRRSTPELDEELRQKVDRGDDPLADDRFVRCRTVDESKALNERREPAVIIASSGMATGGRILHHLAHRLGDPLATVILVGYQAVGTRGRALQEGATTISIHGRRIDVRAEVRKLPAMSAHADVDELVRWCRALPAPPARVFLNHGEDAPRKALAASIAELDGWPRAELPLFGATAPW